MSLQHLPKPQIHMKGLILIMSRASCRQWYLHTSTLAVMVIWCKWSWVVLLCVKRGVFRKWVELSNKKIKVTLNVMAWLYWKHVKELQCWTKRCQTHLCNCSCTNEASSIATHIGDWKPGCICYQSNIQMFCLLCVRYVSSSVTHSYCNLNTSSWSKLSAACPSHVLMCFIK